MNIKIDTVVPVKIVFATLNYQCFSEGLHQNIYEVIVIAALPATAAPNRKTLKPCTLV